MANFANMAVMKANYSITCWVIFKPHDRFVLHMKSAQEINFLESHTTLESESPAWLDRITNVATQLKDGFSSSPSDIKADTLIARDGGFVLNNSARLQLPDLLVEMKSGLIGTATFVLIGALIATGVVGPQSAAIVLNSTTASPATFMTSSQESVAIQTGSITAKEAPMNKSGKTTASSSEASAVEASTPESNLNREVYAFLPYWFVDSAASNIDYQLLSTLAYFDVGLNGDGTVDTRSNGYRKMHDSSTQKIFKKVENSPARLAITFSAFNDATIEGIILKDSNQKRAIDSMIRVAKEQGATGINIDLEYQGKASDEVRAAFSKFVSTATRRAHKEIKDSQVTVSIYAASAKYRKLYVVDDLAKSSDGLFIMGYDYYTAGSGSAGPVAPLTGAPESYWYDITTAINDHLEAGVPANKMILGVPYYGYDWPTTGHSPKSSVIAGPNACTH